jgi:hypothetical protein
MTEAAAVLTPLTQNADCNFQNGIYELQLATYNIDESVITNLVETAPELERLRTALDNIDLSANKVTYDNTHSGMTATKVQGAIDEINDNLTASNQTAGVTDVPFRFGCTDDGKFGYIINQGGADSVIPFKVTESFNTEYQLGTEHQLMISADLFIYVPVMGYSKIGLNRRSTNISVSYKFKYSDGTYSTPTTITLSVNVPVEFTVPNNAIAFMLKYNGSGQAAISYGMKA